MTMFNECDYIVILMPVQGAGGRPEFWAGPKKKVQESLNFFLWWRDSDSNRGHEALQATALPTELSRHDRVVPANNTHIGALFQALGTSLRV